MKTNPEYREIKDNYRPFWTLSVILICGSLIMNLFIGFTLESIFVEVALIGTILGLYQGIRRRKCPICKKKMTKAFNGTFMPEYHYCKDCKIYIDTKVGSYGTS